MWLNIWSSSADWQQGNRINSSSSSRRPHLRIVIPNDNGSDGWSDNAKADDDEESKGRCGCAIKGCGCVKYCTIC
jgi:hypothetical protein